MGKEHLAASEKPFDPGIRRISLYILFILVLILAATFLYSLQTQRKAERLLIEQEARAVTQLFESMQLYLSQKQDVINRNADGSFHFKGLNPEAVGRGVADLFNQTSDHRIKLTALSPRNPANRPDDFERTALQTMQSDPHRMEYSGGIDKSGVTYFYFVKRLNLTADCMGCHGGPAGQLDVTGYPREGKGVGDFGGAISVQIPYHTVAAVTGQSTLILLLFTLGLAGGSIYLVSFFLRRIQALSSDLALKNSELAQHNDRLAELERLKGELFHMLVHDMKAPLTFMIGSLQMLQEEKDGPLTEEQGELVALVLRGCNRLEEMITNILDINRLEEGKLDFSIADTDVSKLLTDKEAVWQRSIQTQKKTLSLDLRASRRIIQTDRHILERILENLVSNAVKHTRPGSGRVHLTVSDWVEPEGVLFQVTDNGEGIPEAYRDKIFDKYSRAQQQELGLKSDTGLGLTFCKMAVTCLGGRIWLEESKPSGTTFAFYLPSTSGIDPSHGDRRDT